MPISRQNPFSTNKAVARLPLRYIGFLVSFIGIGIATSDLAIDVRIRAVKSDK